MSSNKLIHAIEKLCSSCNFYNMELSDILLLMQNGAVKPKRIVRALKRCIGGTNNPKLEYKLARVLKRVGYMKGYERSLMEVLIVNSSALFIKLVTVKRKRRGSVLHEIMKQDLHGITRKAVKKLCVIYGVSSSAVPAKTVNTNNELKEAQECNLEQHHIIMQQSERIIDLETQLANLRPQIQALERLGAYLKARSHVQTPMSATQTL